MVRAPVKERVGHAAKPGGMAGIDPVREVRTQKRYSAFFAGLGVLFTVLALLELGRHYPHTFYVWAKLVVGVVFIAYGVVQFVRLSRRDPRSGRS